MVQTIPMTPCAMLETSVKKRRQLLPPEPGHCLVSCLMMLLPSQVLGDGLGCHSGLERQGHSCHLTAGVIDSCQCLALPFHVFHLIITTIIIIIINHNK